MKESWWKKRWIRFETITALSLGLLLPNGAIAGPQEFDFGDAPDGIVVDGVLRNYPTLLANNGARHRVVDDGIILARTPDPDPDGQPSANADGDDLDGDDTELMGDDEGAFDFLLLRQGEAFIADIPIRSVSNPAFINLWIDFNRDGDFDDLEDQVVDDGQLTSLESVLFRFPLRVPTDASLGVTFARLRVSTQSGLAPAGPAPDGQVEDFPITIFPPDEQFFDFGDAPDSYRTTLASNGPRHRAVGPTLGRVRDHELDAQMPLDGNGDNRTTSGGESGHLFGSEERSLDLYFEGRLIGQLVAGRSFTNRFEIQDGGGSARFYFWIDFNGDGDFEDAGERISGGTETLSDGIHEISFNVPDQSFNGITYARLRVSTQEGLSFDGEAIDGEVEDFSVFISGPRDGSLVKSFVGSQVRIEEIGHEIVIDIPGLDSQALEGVDLSDLDIITDTLVGAGVDPKSIELSANQILAGAIIETVTNVFVFEIGDVIVIGDLAGDPCLLIVLQGTVVVVDVSVFTTTIHITEILTITGSLAGPCPQPYPDFAMNQKIDGADLLRLLEGSRLGDVSLDLTEDNLLTHDDLFEFSLSWFAPDCVSEQ